MRTYPVRWSAVQSHHGLHHCTGPLHLFVALRPQSLETSVGASAWTWPTKCARVRAVPGAAAAGACATLWLIAVR